jgi:hypothetical protein
VVLSIREPESWVKSIQSTIGAAMESPLVKFMTYLDSKMMGRWYGFATKVWTGYFTQDYNNGEVLKKRFFEHYDEIRAVVPKENLLEWRVQEGWEPLCKFLGKDVPSEPFPRINDGAEFAKDIGRILNGRFAITVKNGMVYIGPLVAVGIAAFFARSKGFI